MKKILKYIVPFVLLFTALPALALDNPAPNLFVNDLGGNTFIGILNFIIMNILLPIAGIVAILFIIIGGFQMITSRGNEEQAEAGKKTLTNAVIGLVIVLLSYTIILVVFQTLNG